MMMQLQTRDGGMAVIMSTDATNKRCYIGAYFTGDQWIPTTWLQDGRWHDKLGHPRGLDLHIPKDNETTISKV